MGEAGMSTTVKVRVAWVLAWLSSGVALAQDPKPTSQPESPPTTSPIISDPLVKPTPGAIPSEAKPVDSPIAAVTQEPQLPPGSVCSPWSGPGGTGCCGPIGGNGPILSELFIRSGINLPVAGGIFNNATQAGFIQSFGARSLFFNPVGSSAWTAEFGIDYIFNNGSRPDYEFDIFGIPAQIREYQRAAVHIAFGKEIYMFTPGYQCGRNYRVGLDVGGRYGYSRANFNVVPDDPTQPFEFDRRSDVYGGFLVGFHTDVEIPLGPCFTFVTGVRAEWCYNFSDIIPTWDSDLQDVNIMMNFGWKY